MFNALRFFEKNINDSSQLIALFEYTKEHLPSMNFDDLLRSHLVHAVSAFDKLLHDIIRIGMLEIFQEERKGTSKYFSEGISLEIHNKISKATIPPKEYYFESEMTRKLSYLSFQDPKKIADGLSLIWSEQHKWQVISKGMRIEMSKVKTTLKTISTRRNQIVHEADINIATGKKYFIEKEETENVSNFILSCGNSIYNSVKL